MARTNGAKNKKEYRLPHYASLPTKERITFLANLIVDHIEADQQSGKKLLSKLERLRHESR